MFCGWRCLPVDWEISPDHDLSNPLRQQSLHDQLADADCIFAAFDCSTKSRAREIPRVFQDGRKAPGPLRSIDYPSGLPSLTASQQQRVATDNAACSFVLDEIASLAARGGISVRENPLRSLHWHYPQEVAMEKSNQWWDTDYAACCFAGARCKQQRLRHNVQEIADWPPIQCHHIHHPHEWDPWESNGVHIYPSKEEAEYTAPLCFAISVACSWWAVRTGRATLRVPRAPTFETVGRRDTWLAIDSRALRSWAMTPLAISLGLRPLDPHECSRLPIRAEVSACLSKDGSLPPRHIYVGQGSHRHRLATTKWQCPWIAGHNCTQDEWLPLFVNHICDGPLWHSLHELQGQVLVCDCDLAHACEADVLAGLCFDATTPHQGSSLPKASSRVTAGTTLRRGTLATTVSRAMATIPASIPATSQEAAVLAFCKLFPASWFEGFQFPMVEDLINHELFQRFPLWLAERGSAWDGPLGPAQAPAAVRLRQRHTEGQQAGAHSHRAALPPLLPYGLDPDEHFVQARGLAKSPLPTEALAVLDPDVHFAAWSMGAHRGSMRPIRQQAVGVLKELKRRWAGVTSHLRTFQSVGIRQVTAQRDIGLIGLLMTLMSWPDVTYPHGLVVGLPAVGFAPCYGIFPELVTEKISFTEVLGSWEEHNYNILTSLRPGPNDDFALLQSCKDADKGFCSYPLTRTELLTKLGGKAHRLVPRCVITQSSGKQRIIDDAAKGGQSETSRDANKLVLCSPLRPAQHVQAVLATLSEEQFLRAQAEDSFESGGEDWPDAYRHSPMSLAESLLCVVTFWHQDWQAPAFQIYYGLLFGLPLAVTSFNRFSRFVEACGRRLLLVLVSMYFDDACITDWSTSAGSGQWAFTQFNTLLGSPFAEEKRQEMAPSGVFLGLQHSFEGCLQTGSVRFWGKDQLEAKLLGFINDARLSKRLSPGQAAKIYGLANFFEQGIYGRIGCGGLAAIKARQYENGSSLNQSLLDSFALMEAVIKFKPERLFPIRLLPHPRFCIASDAALEQPKATTGGFLIIWLDGEQESREGFVADIPPALYDWLTPGDYKIAQLELIQVLFALCTRASQFRGRRGYWYIDNIAALMSLIRGRSLTPDLERLSHLIHIILFALQVWIYWEWIPSKSNWSDAISRLGFKDPWYQRQGFSPHSAFIELGLLDLPFPAVLSIFRFL